MNRVTYYDELAGCFKIKADISVNIVQQMGAMENLHEAILLTIKDVKEGRLNADEAYTNIELIMEA